MFVNLFLCQAGLLINITNVAGRGICGASLVSTNRLVTAAHCWYDGTNQANRFTVVLGTINIFSGGTRMDTSEVFTHSEWTPSEIRNDIAMIYLPTCVETSSEL
jgi:secreted trypsin-like serine protease